MNLPCGNWLRFVAVALRLKDPPPCARARSLERLMTIAPLPSNEADRLATLHDLAVLDTPPEPAFDDLTRLAATLCGAPIALVSVVDAERQWFKSRYGIDATETPREVAFCTHAILDTALFVVEDATADDRFWDNPLVTGEPNIRFYAGMPLITPDGHAVGTLCVIDRVPRTLRDDQREALRVLARQVVAQLQLRRQVASLQFRELVHAREHETFRVLFEQSSDAHLIFDERDGILDCNRAAVNMLRCRDKSEVLASHPAVLSPEFQPDGRRSLDKCVDMDAAARRHGFHRFDWTHRRADGEEFPCEVTLTPVELHGRPALLVVWHDLTDRKQAEDALRENGERWRRQQNALLELTREDLRGADEAVGPGFLAVVARALRVERVSVWYLSPDRAALRCVGLYESPLDRHSSGVTLTAPVYPNYFRALVSEEVIAASDAATDPRTSEFRDGYLRPLGIAAMLDAPLRLAGQVRGVLCHEHVGSPRAWTADEQVFALAAANILSLAAEQAERKRAEDALRESEERFRSVVDRLAEGVVLLDRDSRRVLRANPAFLAMLGYTAEEMAALTLYDFVAHDPADIDANMVEVATRGQFHLGVRRYKRKDRELVHVTVSGSLLALDGRPVLCLLVQDVTAEKRAADALRASEALLDSAFESAAIGMSLVAPDGRWLRVNRSLTAFLGYSPAELLATDFQTLTHPDDLDADLALVRQVLAGEVRAYHMEKRYFHKDGRTLHALLSVSLVRDTAGVPLYFVSQIQDIGQRKAAEEAVRASELKFRLVVDRLAEGMFVVDPAANRFVEVNAAMLEMLGYTADEFLALSLTGLVAGESSETVGRNTAAVHESLAKHGRCDLGRKHLRRKDGGVVPVEVRMSLVPTGDAGLHAVIIRDITEQVAAEERLFEYQLSLEEANAKLRALAATDGLTGIRNRAAFNDRLTEEYDRAARFGRPLSLLLMDVDHFKMFNDSFGHPAGDDVLKTVARTLVTTARITDFVARYGGEEFVIILPDTDIAGAMVVAERCRRAIAAVSWRERAVTVSVGVSTRTGDTAEAADLVKQADEALYRSKAAGRNRVLQGCRAVPTTALTRMVALSEPDA